MAVDYQQRYDNARPSYLRTNEKRFADLEAGTTILIPSPQDIETAINALGPDETITFSELRSTLASSHGAQGTCPVMTGMNLKVLTEVNNDARDAGMPSAEITPTWKVLR